MITLPPFKLLRAILKHRIQHRIVRTHDWVGEHFIGVVIVFFLGIMTPLSVLSIFLGVPALVPQVGITFFFIFLAVLIFFGGKGRHDTQAAAEVERAYQRYRIRRQYKGLKHTPDSMIDDVFQPRSGS